jgi:hypothetical protein
VSKPTIEQLELIFDSGFPTARAPESVERAARLAAAAKDDEFCDHEAPTGVAAERPVFPAPPRSPAV